MGHFRTLPHAIFGAYWCRKPTAVRRLESCFQVVIGIKYFLRPSQTCKCTREYLFSSPVGREARQHEVAVTASRFSSRWAFPADHGRSPFPYVHNVTGTYPEDGGATSASDVHASLLTSVTLRRNPPVRSWHRVRSIMEHHPKVMPGRGTAETQFFR